jgi:hypothetical protein
MLFQCWSDCFDSDPEKWFISFLVISLALVYNWSDSLRQRRRHPAAEGAHSLPVDVIETTNTLVVVNTMADQPSFLSCLGHFSYSHLASLLIRFLRRSHDTHTTVLMRVPVGRRKKKKKKMRFTCCIWMSHYNMQMGDDEPKRARAENKIKKRPTIFWGGESRRRERFLQQPYPKYPRQQPGQREKKKKKKRRDFSRIYVQEREEKRDELLIFSETLASFPCLSRLSSQFSTAVATTTQTHYIYTTGTIDYTIHTGTEQSSPDSPWWVYYFLWLVYKPPPKK